MAELSKLGRYELRRILGRGAMGVVYEGFDPTLSRRVAVKTILKNAALDADTERAYAARFILEAKAVARLNHPHIVQVHDFGVEGEIAYLVMEFIEGRELRSFFEAKEKFALDEVVRVMGELLDALDFAHEAGVIHRDVKPANVMLDAQRRAKLADFGVARIQDSAQRSLADTMVGTPAFMSPEQISGVKIDRRTDIFSAGNILYQLLTGEQPFKGEGAWTVAKAIMQDDPPRPSSIVVAVSPVFDEIVNKALAKKPEHRFASAREFAAALRGSLSNERPPPPAAPKQKVKVERRTSEAEVEFWRSIQNSNDRAEFEVYLDEFPDGTYSQLARIKLAKLIEPIEAARKEAEETAKRETEERAREEAEQRARRKAEEEKRRQAEEQARLESEAVARRAAEEKARREAQELAKREAEAKARREAEEKALREALEKAKREAGEKAKREAEEKARQAKTLAKVKQQEEAARSQPAAADPDSTVAIGRPAVPTPGTPAEKKKSLLVPAIISAMVIGGGVAAFLALNRTPSPAPAPVAEAPSKPAAPVIDQEKIRREIEERLRREFMEKAAAEKVQMEKALAEKVAAEKVAVDRLASAKTAVERESAEKASQKAAAERIAAEKAAAEKSAASIAAVEKAAADRLATEKAAAGKAAAEKATADKLAAEKAAGEKAAAEKAALEKAGAAKAATIAAKPGWPNPGDRWVYEIRDANRPEKRSEAIVEVQTVTSSAVRDVFRIPGGAEVNQTHTAGAHFVNVAPGIASFSPYLWAFQEIRAGDRWPNIEPQALGACASNASVECSGNGRVVGTEKVTVKAGTYDSWKIVVEVRVRLTTTLQSAGVSSQTLEYSYWFAKEARRFVKYQSRASGNWTQPNIDMELVSYTPTGSR